MKYSIEKHEDRYLVMIQMSDLTWVTAHVAYSLEEAKYYILKTLQRHLQSAARGDIIYESPELNISRSIH